MYYQNPNIARLQRSKFHEARGEVLRLDMNESPEGLPEGFVERVKEKITPGLLASYPEKETLTALLAQQNKISERELSITAGSDEAMRLLFECFGEEGKEAVMAAPSFEMYRIYAEMTGMRRRTVEYEEDLTLSVPRLLKAIGPDTRLVILLNPNSPIGTEYREEEVRAVIQKARDCGAVVVIDEAYHGFSSGTFLPLIKEYENLLVLRTFSKLFAMAGLRVGYAAGNEKLISMLEKAQSTFNVNTVGLLFAQELLQDPDLLQRQRQLEKEGHAWLEEALRQDGYRVFSRAGNWLLFYPRRGSAEIVRRLKEKKIFIRDYQNGVLKGWLRVSTGGLETMQKFYAAFCEAEREE